MKQEMGEIRQGIFGIKKELCEIKQNLIILACNAPMFVMADSDKNLAHQEREKSGANSNKENKDL